ncbi:DUF6660 family protein [Zunongwangia sp. HGR-M22]|uniref:DUF6660 family protein n=1 Tax=Zunongwangia sp. HGR-M22 TaxID=3015168 RepID=UPI0022DDF641|nr:DUF6660 family protein [Zunongwangia sp. HGR-M22]WBL25305.1 hypothetical protein PBT91_15575 [Zunongwangia sp. HGR-M22]
MKFIGIILAVLFLSLSFLPCSDVASDNEEHTHVVESHSDHDGAVDLCTPFCYCQCCHNHMMTYNLPNFEISNPSVLSAHFGYLITTSSAFTDHFIPPPQV